MGGLDVTYAGAFVAGLLSFLSPCVLPLIPPYLCYLGGVSLDQLSGKGADAPDRRLMARTFLAAVAFVLGFSTVFVALGASASAIGKLVVDYFDILSKIAGVVVIFLGLHFMGVLRIPILYRDARVEIDKRPAGLFGAYIIGLAFAFGWTPCVGPVLAAVLFVAGGEGSLGYGTSLLAVYSAGLGVPFLAATLLIKPFLVFMTRFRRHVRTVERIIGVLLVGTGILFLTGAVNEIAFWILETFPSLGKVG